MEHIHNAEGDALHHLDVLWAPDVAVNNCTLGRAEPCHELYDAINLIFQDAPSEVGYYLLDVLPTLLIIELILPELILFPVLRPPGALIFVRPVL